MSEMHELIAAAEAARDGGSNDAEIAALWAIVDAVTVPPLAEGTEPTNERRARFGALAVLLGTPDVGQNGDDADGTTTDAADAIANVLHWAAANGGDIERATERALQNYYAESQPEPCPVCGAYGADESCTEGGRLVDDHGERG